MEILDIHTHRALLPPYNAIWNCMPNDRPFEVPVYRSVGLHPWYIPADNDSGSEARVEEALRYDKRIVAIGEAGLDKVTATPWDRQLKAFEWQLELADRMRLPLILHVVKAHNEIIELKRKYHPRNQWIVHGFRGKKQLAEQYLKEGFFLSFGEHYNEESLRVTPADRMFFETDDSLMAICDIYRQAAEVLKLPVEELTKKVQRNIREVFFNGEEL